MSTSHNDALWLRPYGEIETHVPECGVTVLPGRIAALTHPLNKGRTIQLPDRELYDPDLCTVANSGVHGFDKGEVIVLAPDHGAYYPHISPDKRELRIVGVACPWWESVLAKYDEHDIHPAPGWMLVEREPASGPHPNPLPFTQTRCRRSSCGTGEGTRSESLSHSAGPSTEESCHEWERLGEGRRVLLVNTRYTTIATVIASCGDDWTQPYKGERVCIQGMRTYFIRNENNDQTTTGRPQGGHQETPRLALVRAPIASKQWLQSLRKQT